MESLKIGEVVIELRECQFNDQDGTVTLPDGIELPTGVELNKTEDGPFTLKNTTEGSQGITYKMSAKPLDITLTKPKLEWNEFSEEIELSKGDISS